MSGREVTGCLNSTKIPKVGIPKAWVPKVGNSESKAFEARDSEGRENPHSDSPQDRGSRARDSEVRDSENRDSESRDAKARDSENGQIHGPLNSDTLRRPSSKVLISEGLIFFCSHALYILSADDSGRFIQNSREVAQDVGQNAQSM